MMKRGPKPGRSRRWERLYLEYQKDVEQLTDRQLSLWTRYLSRDREIYQAYEKAISVSNSPQYLKYWFIEMGQRYDLGRHRVKQIVELYNHPYKVERRERLVGLNDQV